MKLKINMTGVRKRLAIRARIDSIMGDPKDGADIQALLASEKASQEREREMWKALSASCGHEENGACLEQCGCPKCQRSTCPLLNKGGVK